MFLVTTTTSSPAARARASTIVWKLAMAVTGLVFIGYLLLHMYGNLKVFAGQEAFDEYAHHLRVFGEPMLPDATGCSGSSGSCCWCRCSSTPSRRSSCGRGRSGARTTKYHVKKAVAASLSSRIMRWGGVALLLFVIFHLLHLTTHTINPGGDSGEPLPADGQRLLARATGGCRWSTCSRWPRWPCTCGTACGARRRRSGSPTPRGRGRGANVAGYTSPLVIAGGFALVPLSILFGIVE